MIHKSVRHINSLNEIAADIANWAKLRREYLDRYRATYRRMLESVNAGDMSNAFGVLSEMSWVARNVFDVDSRTLEFVEETEMKRWKDRNGYQE